MSIVIACGKCGLRHDDPGRCPGCLRRELERLLRSARALAKLAPDCRCGWLDGTCRCGSELAARLQREADALGVPLPDASDMAAVSRPRRIAP